MQKKFPKLAIVIYDTHLLYRQLPYQLAKYNMTEFTYQFFSTLMHYNL